MKTAVITGISGQDGAYLSKLLIDNRYKVIGIVRPNSSRGINNLIYLGLKDKIIIKEINLLSIDEVKNLIISYRPDEIYNLAAQSSVGDSFHNPHETFSFNTGSLNNLLEVIRLHSSKTKLYQASSSEMYGKVDKLPITLCTKMNPLSPYAVSKVSSYYMIKAYRESYNLFVSNGILFNHESYLRSNNFFIKKVISGALEIKLGKKKKLRLGNLDLKRDFGFAPSYVEAMWKMLQIKSPSDFIICSGVSLSLREIVEYIFEKFNLSKTLIEEDLSLFRPNEIVDIYGDNSISKKTLKWEYNLSFYDVLDKIIVEEIKNKKEIF